MVKLSVDVAVTQVTVTETCLLEAPGGTFTVIVVAVLLITCANVPLNIIMLFDAIGSNPVPVIVTIVPTIP